MAVRHLLSTDSDPLAVKAREKLAGKPKCLFRYQGLIVMVRVEAGTIIVSFDSAENMLLSALQAIQAIASAPITESDIRYRLEWCQRLATEATRVAEEDEE